MKKFGKVMLIGISALVVGIIIVAFGPVQVHRLFGGYNKADRNFYPQWINNEEYCYLRVESYYIPVNIWPTPLQMLDPRGPNATFYIYKVNINEPDKRELLGKIDLKITFGLYPGVLKPNINGEKFTFRRLDNSELVLIIRGRLKYIAYYLNTDGRILKKKVFSANSEFLDWRDIVDISPDGEKLLLDKETNLYTKDIREKQECLLAEAQLYHWDYARWLDKRDIAIYRVFDFYTEKNRQDKYEVYITDEEKKNIQLLYAAPYDDFEKVKDLLLDTVFSPDSDLLFLSKIGMFEKQDGKWRMIKDFKDMEFNFFYPDWSPDGKYLIGITDGDNLKLIKYEDLLKD